MLMCVLKFAYGRFPGTTMSDIYILLLSFLNIIIKKHILEFS